MLFIFDEDASNLPSQTGRPLGDEVSYIHEILFPGGPSVKNLFFLFFFQGRAKDWNIGILEHWKIGFEYEYESHYPSFQNSIIPLLQGHLNFSFSRASIFSNRLLCLPPAKGVSSQTFTISFASPFPTILPPIIKIFASLCSRLPRQD